MNKDQVQGAVKDAAGKVQQKTGEAIGSTDQQAKGLLRQVEGKVQKAFGDVKEAVLTKEPKSVVSQRFSEESELLKLEILI